MVVTLDRNEAIISARAAADIPGRPARFLAIRRRSGTVAAVALLVAFAGEAVAATKIGTPGNDTINGTALADILGGRDGKDTINGLGGDDKVYGDTGNDRLYGGDGNDQVYGGPGDDTIEGGPGNDRLFGQEGADVMRGGPGDDYISGDDLGCFEGCGEPDRIYGDAGADTIYAGPEDVAFGGDGNDRITVCNAEGYGELGNDTLQVTSECQYDNYGFSWADGTVRGGPGADTLVFDTPFCGDIHVTFIGWEPGIDQISGKLVDTTFPSGQGGVCSLAVPAQLGGVREYALKYFDANRDRHVNLADGPRVLPNGDRLDFPINPLTGKRSLKIYLLQSDLYLPDVTTLF